MLTSQIVDILDASKTRGWVLEPDAKRIFSMAGLPIPRFSWAKDRADALLCARKIGYPVVAKVVSALIVHKSDVGGVAPGIDNDAELDEVFSRLALLSGFEGILVEEMILPGPELIVGAVVDYQFGPVVLLGLGGTAAEVYDDTSIRLAPLKPEDVHSMVKELKARPLLEGYRGVAPVDMEEVTRLLVSFSEIVMEMEPWIESVDLNPIICSATSCVIADARIMLKKDSGTAK